MNEESFTIKFSDNWIDLDKIYESGQVFTWERIGKKAYITEFMGNPLSFVQKQNSVLVYWHYPDIVPMHIAQIYLQDYFDCDINYDDIYHKALLSGNEYMAQAAEFAKGIRILKQDLWETIVCFIISQNNNIPRIKKTIKTMCLRFGHFPSAHNILSHSRLLSEFSLGYREKYLVAAAQEYLDELDSKRPFWMCDNYMKCKEHFMRWHGIGPKVADCICLYGLHHLEAFPRDTWIKRIETEHFCGRFPDESYPDCAGALQQYMFYYERIK